MARPMTGSGATVDDGVEMAPVPYRVRSKRRGDLRVGDPVSGTVGHALPAPQPGEFMMLYAFGVGEVAISVSGDPAVTDGTITHTIRVGRRGQRALCAARAGRDAGGARARSAPAGDWSRPPDTTWSSSPAASVWPASARGTRRAGTSGPVRPGGGDRRCPFSARTSCSPRELELAGSDDPQIEVHLTVDVPGPGLARRSRASSPSRCAG